MINHWVESIHERAIVTYSYSLGMRLRVYGTFHAGYALEAFSSGGGKPFFSSASSTPGIIIYNFRENNIHRSCCYLLVLRYSNFYLSDMVVCPKRSQLRLCDATLTTSTAKEQITSGIQVFRDAQFVCSQLMLTTHNWNDPLVGALMESGQWYQLTNRDPTQ